MCSGGQLQYRCALAVAEAREQHQLSIREFQRIVMARGDIHVDLPEASEPLLNFPAREKPTQSLAFDILVERDFRAGQQADRDIWLADGSKAASDGIVEPARHKLVFDFGRPRCNVVQTIVTHRCISSFL